MEMHGIERREVQDLVERSGGKILDVLDMAELFLKLGGWRFLLPDLPETSWNEMPVLPIGVSFLYAVTKPS